MNGLEKASSVLATRWAFTSILAAALALIVGGQANAQVTSADIVDGQVKTPDLASAAVTTSKIAGNAVTGAKIADNAVTSTKVQNNSLTGADIQDGSISTADISASTLTDINASELNGFKADELIRVGEAEVTQIVDLPSCSLLGLAYLTKTINVPFKGNVLVTAMFTTQASTTAVTSVAARVDHVDSVVQHGIWAEDHTAFSAPGQRSNLVSTELFAVEAGTSTLELRVCDASDTDQRAAAIRGKMTFVYTPNPPL